MTRKRVLIIESGKFLGGVITNLFSTCEQLEVITTDPSDWLELLEVMHATQPQIVIIDDTLTAEYLTHLLVQMQHSQTRRIIIVNTDSNQVQVYYKQDIEVRQSQDVFAIL